MSAQIQYVSVRLEAVVCPRDGCGITFGVPETTVEALRRSHGTFYCPHGHNQYFPGKSDLEKAKEETERVRRDLTQRLAWSDERERTARKRADREERRARTFKGMVTRVKKRVGNGVCPCCNRSFQDLMRHMETKHPAYKAPK